jgi:hypothetical protein
MVGPGTVDPAPSAVLHLQLHKLRVDRLVKTSTTARGERSKTWPALGRDSSSFACPRAAEANTAPASIITVRATVRRDAKRVPARGTAPVPRSSRRSPSPSYPAIEPSPAGAVDTNVAGPGNRCDYRRRRYGQRGRDPDRARRHEVATVERASRARLQATQSPATPRSGRATERRRVTGSSCGADN